MAQPSSSAVGQQLARLSQILQQQNQAQHLLMTNVDQLQRELAAVQGQQAVQQLQVLEQNFSAAKTKLELPVKCGRKPGEMSDCLFSVEQYCGMVGIINPIDMVKLAVSRLNHDSFTWWQQLACRGANYQLGSLSWTDFKVDLVNAFVDIDCELELHQQLTAMKQTISITNNIEQFRQLVLELRDQAPDDAVLLIIFTEGLKVDVQMQVLLARPKFLSESEQVAERADMALFSAGRRAQQQEQQQCMRQQSWQQRQQQYRYWRPPPPPLYNGPIPMDLGPLQGQWQYGQHPSQFSAAWQVLCYRCGKQGHIKKYFKIQPCGPQQQQPGLYWGQHYLQFSWVQQPPFQFPQQSQFYGYSPIYTQMYAPPAIKQTITKVLQQPAQQSPAAQMPPCPPQIRMGAAFEWPTTVPIQDGHGVRVDTLSSLKL